MDFLNEYLEPLYKEIEQFKHEFYFLIALNVAIFVLLIIFFIIINRKQNKTLKSLEKLREKNNKLHI